MDKMFVNGMRFYGYHGVFAEENRLGQRFNIDLMCELDLAPAGQSDDLTDGVSYAGLYQLTEDIVTGEPVNLLEALGERITTAVMAHSDKIQSVTVKVIKPDPPIPGHYDSVAIEMTRRRNV
ncbi:dihydroneopterin aldolase [Exiguobacterium sp. TNDT2]|uniref:dihydroneopterin aldolase n=1 Tax=Exiguobacterium sp. TNDT2 TaxID=2233531 RepID=UPI0018E54B81|nr:dihydroneopterin aldolase [Exiguobacterium sp. TNDT2]